MGRRLMNETERGVAKTVFKYTIPYDNIYLSTGLGAGDRPFTIPDPENFGNFIIYIGNKVTWDVLIHELAHVWQGHNSNFAWGYTLNSLFSQMVCDDAYKYIPGDEWGNYNVEQQAHIVEDWYLNGRSKSSPLFRYIRDNIWSPKTDYITADQYNGILR